MSWHDIHTCMEFIGILYSCPTYVALILESYVIIFTITVTLFLRTTAMWNTNRIVILLLIAIIIVMPAKLIYALQLD